MELGDRLKEERLRMKLTQDEMAERCEIGKSSYCAYEAGTTQPKAEFLSAFARAGGDVLYILTWQHSAGVLAPDEAALLDNYRHTPEPQRHTVREVGAAFAQYDEAVKKARKSNGE